MDLSRTTRASVRIPHAGSAAASARRATLACAMILALAACERGAQEPTAAAAGGEIEWARAALERNPRIEVVATDTQAGVFTVRDKSSGEVHTVSLDELAAAPVAQLTVPVPSPAAAAPSPEAATPSGGPAESTEDTATASADSEPASATATPQENYTIERTGDQVRVTGPGVSIVSSGGGVDSRGAPGKRDSDPIVCEGRRMMHLDSRNIFVDGDAIIVRAGCELHITNSHIVASGTALSVQGAVAHVNNSTIEGTQAAYNLDGSAKLYLRGSTVSGAPRRGAYAQVQDQGGNEFRNSAGR